MEKEEAISKFKDIAIKNLDVAGLLKDSMSEILKPALDKMVADSANPYDDMAVAALFPVLEKALVEKIDEFLGKEGE